MLYIVGTCYLTAYLSSTHGIWGRVLNSSWIFFSIQKSGNVCIKHKFFFHKTSSPTHTNHKSEMFVCVTVLL